jgi:hypothetical protein
MTRMKIRVNIKQSTFATFELSYYRTPVVRTQSTCQRQASNLAGEAVDDEMRDCLPNLVSLLLWGLHFHPHFLDLHQASFHT